MTNNTINRFISLCEAAKLLGVCVKTIRRLVARHELPGIVKVGRCARLCLSDILSYQQRLLATR